MMVQIFVFDSHLLVFQYSIRHGLTKKAFSELFALIAVHLPQSAKVPSSVYTLKKFFIEIYPEVSSVPQFYCSKCHQLLGEAVSTCDNGCNAGKKQFLHIPIEKQLKHKLQGT